MRARERHRYTVLVDSLKALDPKRPIREADIVVYLPNTPSMAIKAATAVTDSKLVAAMEARFGEVHVTSQTNPAIITAKSKPE